MAGSRFVEEEEQAVGNAVVEVVGCIVVGFGFDTQPVAVAVAKTVEFVAVAVAKAVVEFAVLV